MFRMNKLEWDCQGIGFSVLHRWVNRKDPSGKNIFSGGFLGLDNIGK